MPRVAFNELNQLPDVLDQSNFEFMFGSIPGWGTVDDMRLKCLQVNIPGFGNESFEVALHGFVLKFRGRKTFPRTLTASFVETNNMESYLAMKAWDEFIAGSNSGNSRGYKKDYAISTLLNVYDTTGRVAASIKFENFFLGELSDSQLDGSSSTALQHSITFNYDRIIANGVTLG